MPHYVRYHDFFPFNKNEELLDRVLKNEEEFTEAKVIDYSSDYPNWRSAKVSFSDANLKEYYSFLKQKVSDRYFEVCDILNLNKLDNYEIDVQLTSHNNGDYFKAHTDVGDEETNNRVLTFVYYFHKNPKMFTGGQLLIHCPEKIYIEPENNMIIFFDPALLHEVQTVHCPEKKFENSRFTLNGWIIKL